MTGRKQRYPLLMQGVAICTLAVAVFVTSGCQEDAMSVAEEDGIPTVLIEQTTFSGTIPDAGPVTRLLNSEEALSLILARTYPIRFRYLDAEGNVIHEAVAHKEGDIVEIKRQAREVLRVHSGQTPEQIAASRKAAEERLAVLWRETVEEKRKGMDKLDKEFMDKLDKEFMKAVGKRSK